MTVPFLVFCDVDETLIHSKSMFDFADFYFTGRYGAVGAARIAGLRYQLGQRARDGEPRHVLNRDYYRAWAGEPAAAVTAWARRWHDRGVRQGELYQQDIVLAVRRHVQAGAVLVLVSGSFPAILDPIAAHTGAAHLACIQPRCSSGLLTGDIDGEPMIGAEKGRAVRTILARYPHVAAGDCYAYGDDISDLPMLNEVGHPVPVGTAAELRTALAARMHRARPRGGLP
jgi:HAD superfamily hydrolase (TIGR01490 family)